MSKPEYKSTILPHPLICKCNQVVKSGNIAVNEIIDGKVVQTMCQKCYTEKQKKESK